MEFRILGPLEVSDGERLVGLSGARQKALLALLLLHANEVVSQDRLIDELWGEEPSGSAGTALRVTMSRLRKAHDSMREALGEDIEPRLRGLLQGHAEAAVANEFAITAVRAKEPPKRSKS